MKNNLVLLRQEAMSFIHKNIDNLDIRERQVLFVNCSMLYDKTFIDLISAKDTDSRAFYNDILWYGYPVFISTLYDTEFDNLIGVALPKMDEERILFCRSLLYAFKTIGWIDFFLENERIGNMKISNTFNHCRIKFTKKYHWNEFLEKEYINYYSKIMATAQAESYGELEKRRPEILAKMSSLVFVFLNDFIGYGSDHDIEQFFHEHALLDAQQETEWELFDDRSKFSGINYGNFVETIIDFSGYAIKHINFCHLLQNNNPHLQMENLMYNCSELDEIEDLIMENRGIDRHQAEIIFNNIALNSHTYSLYNSSQLPPTVFIKVSSRQYLHSISGSLWHPFAFMLENLHSNFAKDWDRNANERENLFKKQLYELFEGFTCLEKNIQIKQNGKTVTDIDATIIDRSSGEIAFFQLKWQDLTDFSLKSLSSKAKNFNNTTDQWVKTVKTWIDTCSTEELSNKLGIKEKYIDKNKIYLFVLGRRHGNYSRDLFVDDGCAWAQWYQLLSCILLLKKDGLKISTLHDLVRISSPYNKKIIERKTKYKIGKYTILYGGY